MGSTTTAVKCANCSAVVDDPSDTPVAQRQPCPSCGSTARLFEVVITQELKIRDSVRMKARHGPTGRAFYEARTGADLHRKSGEWMHRDLLIDRGNDRYVERIVDPKTGTVIHECEEPLREHQGHGTAKHKREGKAG